MNKLRAKHNNSTSFSLRDLPYIVVAITIFLSIDPFFTWSSFAGGIGVIVFKGMQLLAMLLMFTRLTLKHISLSKYLSAIIIMLLFFFYCFFTGQQGGTTHPFLIGNILIYVFYAFCVISDNEILIKSFDLLRKIFAVVLTYTLIIYVLILIGIPIPSVVIQSGEAGRFAAGQQYYQNYFGCLLINQNGNLLYRFTSVFTEPGVVGTFSAFFLAANGCDIKKSKLDRVFLISGLLSLSIAFYLMLVVILALKAFRKGGFKLFACLVVISVVYVAFMNINFSNAALSMLQERLAITDTGIAGDNRMHMEARIEYERFLQDDIKTVLLGHGNSQATTSTGVSVWQRSASYKESIYQLGFIGYGLMLAWFIITPIMCYKTKNKYANKFMYSYMLVFIISQYQRPYMKSLFLAYILLAGCIYTREIAVKEKEEICLDDSCDGNLKMSV